MDKNQTPFRWCFIGAGTLARGDVKQITGSGRHQIVTVYTRRPEACREFADRWGAKACASAEDAIVINTESLRFFPFL